MGLAGFEPATARVKVSCLTAWRQPYKAADKGIEPLLTGSEPAVLPLYESAKMTPGESNPPSLLHPFYIPLFYIPLWRDLYQKRLIYGVIHVRRGIRTLDLMIKSHLLYLLSYAHKTI